MFLDKGLFLDGNIINQPEGSWSYGENLVYDEDEQALSNERGIKLYCSLPIDHIVIGHLGVRDRVYLWLFNTLGSTHQIGYIENSKYYTLQSGSFGFNRNFPVIAKKVNDNILVYSDYYNPIRYINLYNITNTFSSKLADLIAPETLRTTFNGSIETGGSLTEGLYQIYFRYVNKDGVYTNYCSSTSTGNYNAFYCSSISKNVNYTKGYKVEAGSELSNSNKQLRLIFSLIDTSYERIEIVAVAKINNIISAKKVIDVVPTASSESFIISKFEGDNVDLEELLITRKNQRALDLEILNNELFAFNIREDDEFNFQRYANNIVVDLGTLSQRNSIDEYALSDLCFTVCPGEVYALYCTLVYNDDRESRAFHIPGRASETGETDASAITGLTNYKKYQVEETGYNISAATDMGYWENENEKYPNLSDYDSTGLGGEDLRGTPVRHHKIPGLNKLITENFIGSPSVGVSEMIDIRLSISNIVIPAELNGIVKGVKIYMAKRNIENSCVLGFAPTLFGGKMTDPSDDLVDNYVSIVSNLKQTTETGTNRRVEPDTSILKAHCFDLLLNKPNINPVFAESEIEIIMDFPGTYKDDLEESLAESGVIVIDTTSGAQKRYTLHAHHSDSNTVSLNHQIKPIDSYKYIPENSVFGDVYNRYGEETLLLYGDFGDFVNEGIAFDTLTSGGSYEERSGLYSIRQVPRDAYAQFYDQDNLVQLGQVTFVTSGTYSLTINSGDIFLCIDGVICSAGAFGDTYETDTDGDATGLGSKSARMWHTYSVNNPYLKRQDISAKNGLLYPHTLNSRSLLEKHDATAQLSYNYNKSFFLDTEVNGIIAHNPLEDVSRDNVNKIIALTPFNRALNNKINFEYLPDNDFIIDSNNGPITGAIKIRDKLLIKCERGCYLTRNNQTVQVDGEDVYVGSNNIFAVDPEPVLDINKNYFGSQSRFSDVLTPNGLVIIDQIEGRVFLFDGNSAPLEISELGVSKFFRLNGKFDEENFIINLYSSTLSSVNNKALATISKGANTVTKYNFLLGDTIFMNIEEAYGKITKVTEDASNVYVYTDYIYSSSSVENIYHYSKIDSPLHNDGYLTEYDVYNNRVLIRKKQDSSLLYYQRYRGIYGGSDFFTSLNINDIFRYNNEFRYKSDSVTHLSVSGLDIISNSFTLSFNLKKNFWVSFHSYGEKITNMFSNDNSLFLIGEDPVMGFKAPGSSYQIMIHNRIESRCNFDLIGANTNSKLAVVFNPRSIKNIKFKQILWNVLFFVIDHIDVNSEDPLVSENFSSIELRNEKTGKFLYDNSSAAPINTISLTNYTDINNKGNVRLVNNYWNFNLIRDVSNNKIFTKALETLFIYPNTPVVGSKYAVFYINEILAKFNHVKK